MTTPTPAEHRFDAGPSVSNHFSWLRTRLSAERTVLSWARTSIALIGFGFTIVKFFEGLTDFEAVEVARRPMAPRYLGLLMIATGTIALVVAIWEYGAVVRYLWKDDFQAIAGMHKTPTHTPVLWTAIVLVLIGVFAFTAIATRMV